MEKRTYMSLTRVAAPLMPLESIWKLSLSAGPSVVRPQAATVHPSSACASKEQSGVRMVQTCVVSL